MDPSLLQTLVPPGAPADVHETHCATVFLVGDRAYKLKKPVDLGFLDFSTREAREAACRRELVLNRRFAPDVYLGVADVRGPGGEVQDHLVVMRRMPAERRLATLVEQGADVSDCLRAVARLLAGVHAASPTSRTEHDIAAVGTRDAVAANWQDNRDTIARFLGEVLPAEEHERAARLASRFLEGRGPLFTQRIEQGMVRDGHGDLLAEDIFCLEDGPRVLDCLEFDDRYRFGDVLLDAGFLAMDLERLGHVRAAERFLGWYEEFSGDRHPSSLTHHYVAYRAHVRTKVACLRHEQGDPWAAGSARHLHRMVLEHLDRGQVCMVLVGGLPGSGKSTVAQELSDAFGWTLLSSDELRKDLAALSHGTSARGAVDEGLYAPEAVGRVYDELLVRARRLLELGESVVLDASWGETGRRREASAVADTTSSTLVQLRCRTEAGLARRRLADRAHSPSPSDATAAVYDAMARRFAPWPEAADVRGDEPLARTLRQARAAVHRQLGTLEGRTSR